MQIFLKEVGLHTKLYQFTFHDEKKTYQLRNFVIFIFIV